MHYDQIIIVVLFAAMFLQMVGFGLFLKINRLSMRGTPPINPLVFKLSKAMMMLTWVALFIQSTGTVNFHIYDRSEAVTAIAVVFFSIGALLQFISYIVLGKNLKFGIPDKDETKTATLKTTGIYQFSRNPMYTGFLLMMTASSLYTLNPLVWVFSVFAALIHHKIVLKEEFYLSERFGCEWSKYACRVRRYI